MTTLNGKTYDTFGPDDMPDTIETAVYNAWAADSDVDTRNFRASKILSDIWRVNLVTDIDIANTKMGKIMYAMWVDMGSGSIANSHMGEIMYAMWVDMGSGPIANSHMGLIMYAMWVDMGSGSIANSHMGKIMYAMWVDMGSGPIANSHMGKIMYVMWVDMGWRGSNDPLYIAYSHMGEIMYAMWVDMGSGPIANSHMGKMLSVVAITDDKYIPILLFEIWKHMLLELPVGTWIPGFLKYGTWVNGLYKTKMPYDCTSHIGYILNNIRVAIKTDGVENDATNIIIGHIVRILKIKIFEYFRVIGEGAEEGTSLTNNAVGSILGWMWTAMGGVEIDIDVDIDDNITPAITATNAIATADMGAILKVGWDDGWGDEGIKNESMGGVLKEFDFRRTPTLKFNSNNIITMIHIITGETEEGTNYSDIKLHYETGDAQGDAAPITWFSGISFARLFG